MPWSEWIQDPDKEWGAYSTQYVHARFGATSVVDLNPDPADSDTAALFATAWGAAAGGAGLSTSGASVTGLFHKAYNVVTGRSVSVRSRLTQAIATVHLDPEVLTMQDGYPAALWPLTEDVDFAVIPGSGGLYVEYEASTNVLLGWQDLVLPWASTHNGTGVFAGGVAQVTRAAVTSALDITSPIWPAYGTGSTVASWTSPAGDSGVVRNQTIPLGALGNSLDWSLLLQPDHFGTQPPSLTQSSAEGDFRDDYDNVEAPNVWTIPTLNYRMPRYRYWIPDLTPPPLMQVQRSDGLGRGGVYVARARGTRQGSNAQRGTY